jgi:hypothetical protein
MAAAARAEHGNQQRGNQNTGGTIDGTQSHKQFLKMV